MDRKIKQYVIKKYVRAYSAKDALRKEKDVEVDDCWLDEKWHDEDIINGFDRK